MISLTMLFARRIWKPLELWSRKLVGHLKWGLMGHPSKNKGHRDEGKWNCGDPAQEISEGKIIASGLQAVLLIFWPKM